MNNISKSQQKEIFRFFATSSTSFSETFNDEYSQSLSKYKRNQSTIDVFGFLSFSESDSFHSSDETSTGDEGPEYLSNDKAKEWKSEIEMQLQRALKIAVLLNSKDEEAQLHKKIEIFRNFVQMKYFETLKLYSETTVDSIKGEIIQTINDTSLLTCLGDFENFSPNRPFSLFFINFVSVLDSSFLKILKMRSKSERIAKTVTAVKKKNFLCAKPPCYMKSTGESWRIEFLKDMKRLHGEKTECSFRLMKKKHFFAS